MTYKKDRTAAKRVAAHKARAEETGGKRTSLTLNGNHVKKLDKLIQSGFGENHSQVIRRLIEESEEK